MTKDFTIDQVSWHTQLVGRIGTDEQIHSIFRSLVFFLQENGLTTRVLLEKNELITDDFAIKVSDLTDNGFELMRKCHDKWLRGIDKGKDPANLKVFEKGLLDILK
jgi:hypothetical protein